MHIVNGGTHGIGRACVEHLIRKGKTVLATGRDQVTGAAMAAALPGVAFVRGDVADPDDVRRVVETALELGQDALDSLVNNAGIERRVPFLEAELTDWDQVLDVNARSAFLFRATRCRA